VLTRNQQTPRSVDIGVHRVFALVAIAAVVGAITASCGSMPQCGTTSVAPGKPSVVSRPSFFGTVTADRVGWTRGRSSEGPSPVTVTGHRFTIDRVTTVSGRCPALRAGSCAAFVGLRRPGVAAWVLIATPQRVPDEHGRLQITPVLVWKVLPSALILSTGIQLHFGRTLASVLNTSPFNTGLRYGTQRRQDPTAGSLYVDPRTGEVLDAHVGIRGCA
jgi:hypothetical protein